LNAKFAKIFYILTVLSSQRRKTHQR